MTTHPGAEFFPSLSPDGKWIVDSGERAGDRDIYLQSVGGQTVDNLTTDSSEADEQPAFSAIPRRTLGPPRLTGDGRFACFARRVTESDVRVATLH